MARRIIGITFIVAAIIGLIFSLAGVIFVWAVKEPITQNLVSTIDLIETTLEATSSGLTVADDTLTQAMADLGLTMDLAPVADVSSQPDDAVIGDRAGQSISLDVNVLMQRSLTVSAPVCFDYIDDRTYLQRLAHQLFAKIQSRKIIPAVEAFPLSQAAEAHKRIESRQTMGAVVLAPGG